MCPPRFILLALACGALTTAACLGVDTYETLKVGTNTYHNVRVIQSNAVELLIGHDDGYKHIKLQELPPELKVRYPYNAAKAEAYEKEQAEQARLLRLRNKAEVRASFMVREQELREKIKAHEKDIKRIRADIHTREAGKKHKAANASRATLMKVRDELWSLQDQLERTEQERHKFD